MLAILFTECIGVHVQIFNGSIAFTKTYLLEAVKLIMFHNTHIFQGMKDVLIKART